MSEIKYVVVPTSNIDYQAWQIKMLNWSRRKVNQKGKLILLNSEDIEGRPFENYEELGNDIIHHILPNWAQKWRDENDGDNWGGIPNKYNAIKWMTENMSLNDDDVLLFMDPDMIFTEPVSVKLEVNQIIGTEWMYYGGLSGWDSYDKGFMYPFIIHFSTLKKIVDKYVEYCIRIRKETNQWVSEMWALDYAAKHSDIDIVYDSSLAHCTAWWDNEPKNIVPKIIHFPNEIPTITDDRLWFKQDFTITQDKYFDYRVAKHEIGRELVKNVCQYQSDYIYWAKWDFDHIFNNYNGSNGYAVFKPWPGGFNNIRMSLELAMSIAYITNRILVLPPAYSMYLLEGESNLGDFFDIDDLGIKTCPWEGFALTFGCKDWDDLRNLSIVSSIEFEQHNGKNETSDVVINMEKINPSSNFAKWKRVINWDDIVNDCKESILFFDENLLGNFYQVIHSRKIQSVKKLIAKHCRYNRKIYDDAYEFIHYLGDKSYYSMHVRRNDFQYKDLFISCEEIYENIKDRIPEGAKLYIATDHKDKSFFNSLRSHYNLYFYDDITSHASVTIEPNLIPIIEQLICTRGIKFIGMDYSTLSSQIYRLRGYMDDIEDKDFHVNTHKWKAEDQRVYKECENFIANWHRDFKDVWNFYEPTIFVSIASYKDSQIDKTIESALKMASSFSRVVIGLCLQDTKYFLEYIKNKNYPNIRIKYIPYEEVRTVVDPRNDIIEELYNGEDYFLQIDSHMRFKKGWDNILINQIGALEDKSIITTYPNEFKYPDPSLEYLNLPNNAPLKFKEFLNPNSIDKRFKVENLNSLNDFEVVDNGRVAAGFLFAPKEWVNTIRIPHGIVYNGEEDYLTYATYLSGWSIKCTSEAVVWHNYDFRDRDGKPYREHNPNLGKDFEDNAVELIYDLIFNQKHARSISDLNKYMGESVNNNQFEGLIKTFLITIPRLSYRLHDSVLDSYKYSKIVNPTIFYGVDGKNDTIEDWWNNLELGGNCLDSTVDIDGVGGLVMSYVDLYKRIIHEKMEGPILIVEDDVVIHEDVNYDFDRILTNFINNMPNDWELGYIGGHAHNAGVEKKVANGVYETLGTMRTTAILYRDYKVVEKLLEKILTTDRKNPIDVEVLVGIHKHQIKCYRSEVKLMYQKSYVTTAAKEELGIIPHEYKDWN